MAIIGALVICATFSDGWQYTDLPMLECAWCHRKASLTVPLERHHELPQNRYPELKNDPFNLLVLCRPCHRCLGHAQNTRQFVPQVGVIVSCYQQRERCAKGAE